MIGKEKIFAMMFADDVGAVADSPEGLQGILNGLKRYCRRNAMPVDAQKTKVMIFRNGGRGGGRSV